MGIKVYGLFLQVDRYRNENENGVSFRYAVTVACGTSAYKVYMTDDFDSSVLDQVKPGTPVRITARPYVNKNGRLAWADGADLKLGE